MPGNSATLHESPEVLPPETVDRHRAIASLMEEFEAVDWYDQRGHAATDDALPARRSVDFKGPLGWEHAAEPTGRTTSVSPPAPNVESHIRQVQPLVELRAPFVMPRAEIDAIARGARDADLDPVRHAARHLAIT